MDDIDRQLRLSTIHVQWSVTEAVFIARSDQFPALSYRCESSLAAVAGLLDIIGRALRNRPAVDTDPETGVL